MTISKPLWKVRIVEDKHKTLLIEDGTLVTFTNGHKTINIGSSYSFTLTGQYEVYAGGSAVDGVINSDSVYQCAT